MADQDKTTNVHIRIKDQQAKSAVRNLGRALSSAGRQADKAAKTGVRNLGNAIRDAARQAQHMDKHFVTADMSRRMKSFNEKTEKGRQLMVAMGGVAGAAGGAMASASGAATYYAGTILYVVGAFEKLDLIIMASIGTLVALGVGLSKLMFGPLDATIERVEKATKAVNEMAKANNQVARDAIANAAGMSSLDRKRIASNQTMIDLENNLNQLRRERNDLIESGGYANRLHAASIAEKIKVAQRAYDEGKRSIEQLKEADRVERAVAQRRERDQKEERDREAARENRTRLIEGQRRKRRQLIEGQRREQEAIAQDIRNKQIADAFLQVELEWQAFLRNEDRKRAQLAESQAAAIESFDLAAKQRQRIMDREAEFEDRWYEDQNRRMEAAARQERAVAQQRMEYASMGATAFIDLAMAFAEGNLAAVGETLKGMAMEAVARAAWHGIMAIASVFFAPTETAKHATLAGMYAAFAATYGAAGTALSAAGGGGGGGGSAMAAAGGPGGQASGYGTNAPGPREQEDGGTKTVIYVSGSMIVGRDADREFHRGVHRWDRQQNPGGARSSF